MKKKHIKIGREEADHLFKRSRDHHEAPPSLIVPCSPSRVKRLMSVTLVEGVADCSG